MDDIQLEEGSATNANKNVKSSATTPAPTGPKLADDSTGPDLSDDLQRTHDNLGALSLAFYNNLSKNEDKVAYLKSIQEADFKARRKGSIVMKLLGNLIVFAIVIGIFVSNVKSKNEIYQAISYCIIYFSQYTSTILDLYWNLGINNKFFRFASYTTAPGGCFLLITVLLIKVGKYEMISSLTFLGLGILFSDWVSKCLMDRIN
ncbi:hypothetical protein C1646_471444 [Rhizophagus diaphanus]|nr:hypothetical protein C1646_471444 [Rhizophagus diaphanus] [Rhizophagus sp. MUCL 43196]